jgi:type IV pilus assembly protein PilY1
MSRSKSRPVSGHQPHGRLLACALTFFATLVASPGYAVDIPNVPLQSQAEYPPANVMFILDDSGSMDGVGMPADLDEINFTKVDQASYVYNTIYYNPAVTYQPWIKADNSRSTGGTSFDAAYGDTAQASGHTVNLAEGTSGSYYTFYVPKTESGRSKKYIDSYRYQFYLVGDTTRVVRSEWGPKRKDNQGPAGDDAGCAYYKKDRDDEYDWRNCTFVTPSFRNEAGDLTNRSEAAEMTNFATWYSYHRTRIKVAKAGASEAFSRIGEKLRIGLDTINRNTSPDVPYQIPVGTDEGLFRGANKQVWYTRLQTASPSSWTPLRRALQRTGDYFSRSDASGPWGPKATDQISCRQNFAILTTDGYWNTNNEVGVPDPFRSIGDEDGKAGEKITQKNALGDIIQSGQYEPKKPFTDPDAREDTLADVAMYYWKRDLRTDLENNIPKSFADEAFWQHMVTFGVSIGLQGTLNPKTDYDSIANGTKAWPNPLDKEDAERIDDLWHAGVNGHGGFLVANNTKEFTEGLLSAFATIAERRGSASNVATNSSSFRTDTRVYYASYTSGKWSGELAAHDASSAGVATLPSWKASQLIPTSGRTILTWNGSSGTVFPTETQVSLLDQSTRAIAPVNGTDNAAYIKGDRSKERRNAGQFLRDRETVLGDIVNSSPMYVKDSQTIFVGANDGMLHAFDASSGVERFAYVPGGIDFTKLATLSSPKYSHEYFVDGPIVVSSKNKTPGKNYLVGTLGRGGKGLYALDVTNPTKFGVNDVLWERTSGTNMGYVLGRPLITTLNDGKNVAIFGNGINSASGHAVLYVVDLQSGTILQEIDTGVGSDNGLSSPRPWDEDLNGTVDYVYAGDLKGNVWKFDFTKSTAVVAFSGKPLFTAASGQPITGDLGLALNPQTGERWVFAGTGSLLTKADLTDSTIQSMYALIDDGSGPITKSQLQQRTIDTVDTVTGNRAFERPGLLPAGKRGWYLDLSKPTAGERVVSRPTIDGSSLTFTSLIPPTSNACDAGGSGYINELNAFTGTAPKDPYFDSNGDGKFDDKDTLTNSAGEKTSIGSVRTGDGMPTDVAIISAGGQSNALAVYLLSNGQGGALGVDPDSSAPQRVSWREILRN